MKTGSIHKLPQQIDTIFKKRVHPIVTGKIRPKSMIPEEELILSQCQVFLKRYDNHLDEIFENGRLMTCVMKKGDTIDLHTFFKLMIVSKFSLKI